MYVVRTSTRVCVCVCVYAKNLLFSRLLFLFGVSSTSLESPRPSSFSFSPWSAACCFSDVSRTHATKTRKDSQGLSVCIRNRSRHDSLQHTHRTRVRGNVCVQMIFHQFSTTTTNTCNFFVKHTHTHTSVSDVDMCVVRIFTDTPNRIIINRALFTYQFFLPFFPSSCSCWRSVASLLLLLLLLSPTLSFVLCRFPYAAPLSCTFLLISPLRAVLNEMYLILSWWSCCAGTTHKTGKKYMWNCQMCIVMLDDRKKRRM